MTWLPRTARIEAHTFIESLVRDSWVVDLGAHKGGFAYSVASRYNCRVLGVEASPDSFAVLRSEGACCFIIGAVGLGHEGDMVELSANHATCASGVEGLREDAADTFTTPSVSLRRILEEVEGPVGLMKVDIEGAELAVLSDVDQLTARHVQQIAVEFHDFLDASLAPAVDASIKAFRDAGWTVIHFSRDNTDVLLLHPSVALSRIDLRYLRMVRFIRGMFRFVRRRGGLLQRGEVPWQDG